MYAPFPAQVSPSSTQILNGTSYGPNSGLGRWGDGQLSKTLVLPWNETWQMPLKNLREFQNWRQKVTTLLRILQYCSGQKAANIPCRPGLFSVACKSHWTSGKDMTPTLPCIPEHPPYRRTRNVTDRISHRIRLWSQCTRGKHLSLTHPWRSLITPGKCSYANISSFPLPLWVL